VKFGDGFGDGFVASSEFVSSEAGEKSRDSTARDEGLRASDSREREPRESVMASTDGEDGEDGEDGTDGLVGVWLTMVVSVTLTVRPATRT